MTSRSKESDGPSSHVSLPGPTNAPMTELYSPKMPQRRLHVSQQNCNISQRAPRSTSRSSFDDHETNFPVKNEADKIRHTRVTAFDCRVKRNMAELSTIMTIDLVVLFQTTLEGVSLCCWFLTNGESFWLSGLLLLHIYNMYMQIYIYITLSASFMILHNEIKYLCSRIKLPLNHW